MNAAFQEASTYHDLSAYGFFAVRAYGQQSLHRLADMPRILDRVPVPPDLQISQAEYRSGRNRTKANVLRVGLNFVDCDLHTSRYAFLRPEQIATALLLFCEDEGIPRPNLINFSGRGIHVKWLLDAPVPAKALVRWGLVQKALCSRLADFGADKFALDASRCLRAVGTINVKSGETARTLWEDGLCWDFDALANEVLQYTRAQCAAHRQALAVKKALRESARALAAPMQTHRPLNLWSIADLWCHRLEDVRELVRMRGWETGGVVEGWRGKVLFVATICCHWAHRPANLEAEAQELARQLCPSFRPPDVRNVLSSVFARARADPTDRKLRLRTQTIIDLLEIRRAEQADLKTLISADERSARKQERDRQARRKHTDRATYEAQAQQRRQQAQALRAAGSSYKAIAAEMQMTAKQIENLLHRKTPTLQATPYTIIGEDMRGNS